MYVTKLGCSKVGNLGNPERLGGPTRDLCLTEEMQNEIGCLLSSILRAAEFENQTRKIEFDQAPQLVFNTKFRTKVRIPDVFLNNCWKGYMPSLTRRSYLVSVYFDPRHKYFMSWGRPPNACGHKNSHWPRRRQTERQMEYSTVHISSKGIETCFSRKKRCNISLSQVK